MKKKIIVALAAGVLVIGSGFIVESSKTYRRNSLFDVNLDALS